MAKRLSVAPKKKNKQQQPLWIVGLAVFCFLLLSGSVLAQSWNPPATQPPGATSPDVSQNIAGLIRLTPPTGFGQFKVGNLAIGTATIANIVQRFEVYGDTTIANSLLAGASAPPDMGTFQLPCDASASNPALYAKDGDNVYIGGSAATACSKVAKLNVFPSDNEYPNGAIYATSGVKNAVWGYSSDNNPADGSIGAGLRAEVGTTGAIAVFGEAVSEFNRGLYAQGAAGGALAALFRGNVIIIGGYLQGNGSQLYRVSSIFDASLPSTGGQGMSAWAQRDISVLAGTTTNIDLKLATGELVRAYSAMVETSSGIYQLYTPNAFPKLKFVLAAPGIQIANTSAAAYKIRLLIHIQTGASILVNTYYPGETIGKATPADVPIIFDAGKTIEFDASVPNAADKTFNWSFADPTTSVGSICISGTSTCTNGSTPITSSNQRVVYHMPADTTQGLIAGLKVEWAGDLRSPKTSRIFKIDMVDIQKQIQNQAIEYNATTANVAFNVNSPLPDFSILKFAICGDAQCTNNTTQIGSENISFLTPTSATYIAPNLTLIPSLVNRHIKVSLLAEPKAFKAFSLYLVPSMALSSKFPSGPQAGQETSTVAKGTIGTPFPLTVTATLGGEPNAGQNSMQCSGGLGTCSGSSSPWSLTYNTSNATLAPQTLSVTWVPGAALLNDSTMYPTTGFSYSKSKTITVGSLTMTGPTTGSSGTFTFTTAGYASPFLSTTMPANQVNSGTWTTGNPEIGGSDANTILSIVTNGTNKTQANFSTSSAGTYTIYGRSTFDQRDVKSMSITYTSGGGCICKNGDELCCANINIPCPLC